MRDMNVRTKRKKRQRERERDKIPEESQKRTRETRKSR